MMGGAMQLPRTSRQLKKTFHNFLLTVVCGFTTILVLKGSTGFENPASSITYIKSENPRPAQPLFFTNHHRPLQKPYRFLTNHHRPLNNLEQNPYFLSSHDRPLHRLANPHPQIPYFPTNIYDRPSSDLPVIRSELQHARLLAEANNLIHNSQAQLVPLSVSLSHALSTEKELHSNNPEYVEPNPSSISTEYPNPNPNLHPNQYHIPDNYLTKAPITSSNLNPIPDLQLDARLTPVFSSSNPNPNQDTNSFTPSHIRASMNENPNQNTRDEQRIQSQLPTHYKPSILLVTGSQPFACDNPMGDYYLMKSLKNKMDYCRLHNLEIFYNMANLDPQMSGFWAKLPLIYTLMLAHPEKEWLWWVDSDAMITDMAFELPMDRYKDYNLVLHGWKELVYEQKSWVGLNTGSFLIRNCQWSLSLLEAWAPMGPKGEVREEAGHVLSEALAGRSHEFEADDQSALIYLLNEQKSKWASKVYLENAYYLHGYWLIIVDRYEEMMERYHSGLGDERWPFVTHFVGCKPCSNNKLALEGKCLEHMERAFNFADNQVLQFYGFQHEALNTHALVTSSGLS